jgi:hypothetical protein
MPLSPAGFGNIHDVRIAGSQAEDRMESFFLGETLKYLYLLQASFALY